MGIVHLRAGACGSEHIPERIGGMSLLSLFSRSLGGTRYARCVQTVGLLIFKQKGAVAHS